MNTSISKRLFELGSAIRNPTLQRQYEELKTCEFSSFEDLTQLQSENAEKFLRFAGQQSPYYAAIFKRHGFDPRTVGVNLDLSILPTTSKRDLISSNSEIHTQFDFKKCFMAETSGTTGEALEFRKNEEWDSITRALMMRSYDWYDVKPWERNGYLWGYNISQRQARKTRLLDYLQNRFRLFRYDPAEIREFARRLVSASFLTGYSSMIYEIAKAINETSDMRSDAYSLKLIKGTSETILDVYRTETRLAFGTEIVSEYGAAEAGLIAFECPQGNLHINVENLILEVDDSGEAVVTNLASYSFPIIRYRLGDAVTLDTTTKCPCKRAHPIIREVLGRKGGTVLGKAKKYPALSFYYVFKNLAIEREIFLNYKAVQKEQGKVDLHIEQAVSSSQEKHLWAELHKYFSTDVEFDIGYGAPIERGQKKAQYFTSELE